MGALMQNWPILSIPAPIPHTKHLQGVSCQHNLVLSPFAVLPHRNLEQERPGWTSVADVPGLCGHRARAVSMINQINFILISLHIVRHRVAVFTGVQETKYSKDSFSRTFLRFDIREMKVISLVGHYEKKASTPIV